MPRLLAYGALGLLVLGVVVSGFISLAGGNTTPASSADMQDGTSSPDDLKPADCAGITLTHVVSGSGTITGSANNELITGSAVADTIDGLGGDDCILGGGGVDSITGGAGTDVCIGGGQVGDSFTTCETEVP